MSKHVPDFINPFRSAEGGYSIAGDVAFARMGRLIELVRNTEGSAQVILNFGMDKQGIPFVQGQIRTEVELICQRCLEPMKIPIQADMDLAIIGSDDEVKRLPERYDPLLVSEQPLSVAELVEDEILLALPAVPRHDEGVCSEAGILTTENRDGTEESVESHANPFAVLARLKSNQ